MAGFAGMVSRIVPGKRVRPLARLARHACRRGICAKPQTTSPPFSPPPLVPGLRRVGHGLRSTPAHPAHTLCRHRSFSTARATANDMEPLSDENVYRKPPQEILDIIDSPPEPSITLSPCREKLLMLHRPPPLPPVAELARPELKLAGLRLDPLQNSRSRMGSYLGLGLDDMPTSETAADLQTKSNAAGVDSLAKVADFTKQRTERPFVGLPDGALLNFVSWSPKGSRVAFTVRSSGEPGSAPRGPLALWVADVDTMQCRRLLDDTMRLNTVFEEYSWVDENTLVATIIPQGRGPAPVRPETPSGPRIQSNLGGKTAQTRTYQDLLKDSYDEALFDYYGQSNLIMVDVPTGNASFIGSRTPQIYTRASPSPDGQFLIVEYLERPYSYLVPCGRFPKRVQLWDRSGNVVREIEALPLAEDIPIAHNSTRQGRRAVSWRSDKGSQLCWIETQDGGDPKVEVSPRDIMYTLDAQSATDTEPQVLITTDLRCGGVQWGDDNLALVYESWYKTRRSVIRRFAPGLRDSPSQVVFDRYYEDVYSDPGSPASRRTATGESVLATLDGGTKLLLLGAGHNPDGKRPFVDLLDLESGGTRRLWESSPPYLEYPVALMEKPCDEEITLDGLSMLISRETPQEPPQEKDSGGNSWGHGTQYYVRTWPAPFDPATATETRITDFPHPYPKLKELQKEIIKYERDDGTPLTATLYQPPGYDAAVSGPLPLLLWAYPREFKTKEAAGQMRDSPFRFTGIGSSSPLLHLARGYAVLDGPTMPIIGEGDTEPNDTYVEQLTASARAAVEEVVRRGVADPKRVAVGGHSYGAFMTTNLLAHAPDLFCCGIAKSGAYNRTLTPFGFQSEERTIWEAPDTYMKMSPFMMANQIKQPLLLIHGEEDNNSGTFPMQSERLYSALKGHGAMCRLVILPHESHGYRGRESIHHSLFEMCAWLDAFCKKVGERDTDADATANE